MKIPRFLALCLTLLPVLPAAAVERDARYVTLPKAVAVETGDKIEVREFFWYGCSHCYSMEPRIAAWLKRKPANVEFVRTPAAAPRWLTHAQAYYAFAALGATEKTHEAIFRAMHEQRRRLDSEKELAEFAVEQGIDATKFKDAFNSFGVRTRVEKAKQLSEAFQVSSVPAFAVDGKYVTNAGMADGEEAVLQVIDELVARAARERKATKKSGKK